MKTPLSFCAIAMICALMPRAATAQQLQQSIHVSSPFSLAVENPYGSVRVEGVGRGDVTVRGRAAPGDSLVLERGDRWVHLRVIRPHGEGRSSDAATDLVLEVPRGTPVDVETREGRAEVVATGGLVRVKTTGGNAVVDGPARTITAETVSGTIDVSASTQAVVATTGTGAVRLDSVRGYIEVFTTDGEVVLADCSAMQATITTVGGRVHFDGTVQPQGLVRIDTYVGDAELALDPGTDAAFEISTFGGSIVNDLGPPAENASRFAPGRELRFTLGSGSARVVVDTFGGSVRLGRSSR